MIKKKYKFLFIFFISVIIFSIIIYKISFYTPPLLDSGKRNIAEKTIDFLSFGWHLTKGSIVRDYLGERGEANEDFAKAGWYRKKYLVKRFRAKEEDITLVLKVYKDLDINSIIENLYFFLMKDKNNKISFFREAGEKFIIEKNWKMAVEAFSKVVDSNPDDYMSYYYLGLSCIHLKKLVKAKGYLDKAIELKPDFADAYYRLGVIAEKEQNWKKAQSLYEITLNILPDHSDSLKALKKIKEKSE